MKSRIVGWVGSVAGLPLLCAGCAVDQVEKAVTSKQQELAYWSEATLWSNPVNICFRNNGGYCRNRCTTSGRECAINDHCDSGETCNTSQKKCEDNSTSCTLDSQCDLDPVGASTYVDAKELIEEALVDAWQDSSGLAFSFNGNCGSNPSAAWMILNLKKTGWGGRCSTGAGADCEVGILDRGRIQDVTVHEVGHGLGLSHEHKRQDGVVCESVALRLEGCQDCADGTCSEANFEACFGGNVSGTQTLTVEQQNIANQVVWDLGPDHRTVGLTKFDPQSVMNYCRQAQASNTDPAQTDWRPTALDRLGIEMLYPRAGNLPLACSERCLQSGNGVVLRTDGAAIDSWKWRGALTWWDSGGLRWTYGLMQSPFGVADALQASGLSEGSHDLFYWGISSVHGQIIVGEGEVHVSDAKWTGIAMSVL